MKKRGQTILFILIALICLAAFILLFCPIIENVCIVPGVDAEGNFFPGSRTYSNSPYMHYFTAFYPNGEWFLALFLYGYIASLSGTIVVSVLCVIIKKKVLRIAAFSLLGASFLFLCLLLFLGLPAAARSC